MKAGANYVDQQENHIKKRSLLMEEPQPPQQQQIKDLNLNQIEEFVPLNSSS